MISWRRSHFTSHPTATEGVKSSGSDGYSEMDVFGAQYDTWAGRFGAHAQYGSRRDSATVVPKTSINANGYLRI